MSPFVGLGGKKSIFLFLPSNASASFSVLMKLSIKPLGMNTRLLVSVDDFSFNSRALVAAHFTHGDRTLYPSIYQSGQPSGTTPRERAD